MLHYSHLGAYRNNMSENFRKSDTAPVAPVLPLTISECESLVEWNANTNGTISIDNAIFNSGTGALNMVRTSNLTNTYSVDMAYVADLSIYSLVTFSFYIVDKRFLSTVIIRFFTTVGKVTTDCLFYSTPAASVANGWNSFSQLCTAFTQVGIGTWADVKAVRFEINLTE